MSDKTVIIGNISNTCWVSVEERLPDNTGYYDFWVVRKDSFRVVDIFYNRGNPLFRNIPQGATHWMPAPSPPPITKGEK